MDFRFKKQYFGNWYIYNQKDKIEYGVNGTSHHYSISKKDYSLGVIKDIILRTIFSTKIYL